jgi:hypothetical protein
MKVWVRQHGELLAACDEELLGRELSDARHSLRVGKAFYGGRLVGMEDFEAMLRGARNGNLVGNRVVLAAKRHRLITCAHSIGGVQYAMFVKT